MDRSDESDLGMGRSHYFPLLVTPKDEAVEIAEDGRLADRGESAASNRAEARERDAISIAEANGQGNRAPGDD